MRDYGNTNAAPYASAPAVGAAGDTYWNTVDATLYVSTGAAWVRPAIAAGAVDYSKRTERTHGARVWRAAALSVASGANTTITFDTVDHNEAAAGGLQMWSAAAPDRLTVKASGVYLIAGTFGFNASAAGTRRDLWIDTGFIAARQTMGVPNIPLNMTVTAIVVLNANAVISLLVYQDSGAAIGAVSSFGALPTLTAIRLG
jgi:hypothetical protein